MSCQGTFFLMNCLLYFDGATQKGRPIVMVRVQVKARRCVFWASLQKRTATSYTSYTLFLRYFKQSKLTSFQRQLNLYGFQRVSSGVDKGCLYHPLFLRGRPDICKVMLRTRTKGNYGTITKHCDEEIVCSNFYDLPKCPPSSAVQNHLEVTVSEDLPHTVSVCPSPRVKQESSHHTLDSIEEFLFVPYTLPAIPSNEHSCPKLFGHNEIAPEEREIQPELAPVLASSSFELADSTSFHSIEYVSSDNYQANVVSPGYGQQNACWPTKFTNEDTVNPCDEIMDPFWGCTFQCIDEDEVQAYDRSLDRRFLPCQL